MHLQIFDCNNYIRRQYSVDQSGLVLRNMYNQALQAPPGTRLYIFDGRNAKAARRAIFPGYKVGRPPAPDEFYKQLDVAKKVLDCAPQVRVEIEGFEADDVIGSIVRGNPDVPITIHSNDGDFRYLCNENVKMSDPTLKAIDAGEVRLYKTLVGDSSDKIPGFKNFGPKSWEALETLHKTCWEFLLKGEDELSDFDPEDLGLTIKQMPWLVLNLKELQGYWQIVNFLPVPEELMAEGTIVGTANPVLANQYLREIMQ